MGKKDFAGYKAAIGNAQKFTANKLNEDYENKEITVYGFSEPLPYKNGEYVVFTVMLSNTNWSPPKSERVVLMKRTENGWHIADQVWSDAY